MRNIIKQFSADSAISYQFIDFSIGADPESMAEYRRGYNVQKIASERVSLKDFSHLPPLFCLF